MDQRQGFPQLPRDDEQISIIQWRTFLPGESSGEPGGSQPPDRASRSLLSPARLSGVLDVLGECRRTLRVRCPLWRSNVPCDTSRSPQKSSSTRGIQSHSGSRPTGLGESGDFVHRASDTPLVNPKLLFSRFARTAKNPPAVRQMLPVKAFLIPDGWGRDGGRDQDCGVTECDGDVEKLSRRLSGKGLPCQL